MNPRVKAIKPKKDYILEIVFTNGEIGVYDCTPLLDFGVFSELRDEKYFKKAKVVNGTVAWPHEQDICPDTLYIDAKKFKSKTNAMKRAPQKDGVRART